MIFYHTNNFPKTYFKNIKWKKVILGSTRTVRHPVFTVNNLVRGSYSKNQRIGPIGKMILHVTELLQPPNHQSAANYVKQFSQVPQIH